MDKDKSPSPSPSTPQIIKVGHVKTYLTTKNPKTGRNRKLAILFTYKDICYDIDGWADSKKYLPEDYDLVYMKIKRNKILPGWISAFSWKGLRLKRDDEVLFWKRNEEVVA